MKKLALSFTLALIWSAPADAQIFGKKTKTPPGQRIGELIVQAKSDPSESKRAAAAEELRDYDAKSHPEVVPLLIDVARSDKSAAVRLEAVDSLSRIRPVSQSAGQAIEWAAAHDDSWKVRWHAKTALTRYQWAGYRAGKNDGKAPTTTSPATNEPPLLDAAGPQIKPGTVGRAPATKATQTPGQIATQPAPLPKIVDQPPALPVMVTPPPQVVQQPAGNVPPLPTPPPIIVDTPGTAVAPPVKAPVPALPVRDSTPRIGVPSAPPALGTPTPTEPNFRPAGQTPPRVPPPAKNDDRGPALTVPM